MKTSLVTTIALLALALTGCPLKSNPVTPSTFHDVQLGLTGLEALASACQITALADGATDVAKICETIATDAGKALDAINAACTATDTVVTCPALATAEQLITSGLGTAAQSPVQPVMARARAARRL